MGQRSELLPLIEASVSEPPLSAANGDFVGAYVRTNACSYIPQILQIPISTACLRSCSPHNALHSLVEYSSMLGVVTAGVLHGDHTHSSDVYQGSLMHGTAADVM